MQNKYKIELDLIKELNKTKCEIHNKRADCGLVEGKISVGACCDDFRRILQIKMGTVIQDNLPRLGLTVFGTKYK